MSAQPAGFTAFSDLPDAPPVLVLHAWWGLNDDIRLYCQALAAAGFNAFAPDLYHGLVVDQIEAAEAAADAVDHAAAQTTLVAAATWLAGNSGAGQDGVAAVGFSLGAFLGQGLTITQPHCLHSLISYYAARADDYQPALARYQAHLAASDPFATDDEVEQWQQALAQAGRPLELHRYAGTGHWFAEPSRRDAYQAEAANLAWQRSLAFLRAGAAG